MLTKYIPCDGFVAVLTPHFLAQYAQRADLLDKSSFYKEYFERIFAKALPNEVVGWLCSRAFIYARKKYNERRARWELEFISCTPNRHFHTTNNATAKMIVVEER